VFWLQASAGLAASGCAAVAALCLRNPANGKALYVAGVPEVILQVMKIHAKDSAVQVRYLLHCFI
jgi:hypothetical protein